MQLEHMESFWAGLSFHPPPPRLHFFFIEAFKSTRNLSVGSWLVRNTDLPSLRRGVWAFSKNNYVFGDGKKNAWDGVEERLMPGHQVVWVSLLSSPTWFHICPSPSLPAIPLFHYVTLSNYRSRANNNRKNMLFFFWAVIKMWCIIRFIG